MTQQSLKGYQALDLTDEKGFLCGRILADLGADVIKIEPPGGHPSRKIGPFYQNTPHNERSLYWFAYNLNKRGITLDIEAAEGKDIFRKLVKTADFLIESFPPGYMDSIGLGYQELKPVNPRLVMTAITPFGQTGPYKDFKGADIVCWGLGGVLCLCGDDDRPPVQCSFPQAYLYGAADASAATMIAFHHRQITGKGQFVDVSIQAAVMWIPPFQFEYWPLQKVKFPRSNLARKYDPAAEVYRRVLFDCRDGQVVLWLVTGTAYGKFTARFVKWIESEGGITDFLKEQNWEQIGHTSLTQEFVDHVEEDVAKFIKRYTKAQLYEAACRNGFLLYPVNTTKDILEDKQLQSRHFWQSIEHPELTTSIIYPGTFAKLSETPIKLERRAPLFGEHNKEIYIKELGLSADELMILNQKGVI